ncbi:unnamed protein product [Pylaiella littoralis]
MSPSRPPGKKPGKKRLRKPDPALAPAVPESEQTRKIPAPRGAGVDSGACAKKAAEEDAEEEEPCCICCTQLPDVGRGIIACGHVFCFCCIHKWSKKANVCPTCRLEFTKITKTLSHEDTMKEVAFTERYKNKKKKCTDRRQFARLKRKAIRVKSPMEGVYLRVFRVKKKLTTAQRAALRHPQGPGGSLHAGWRESYRQAQAQQAQERTDQAATRAREEAAEAQSRARAALQQAVAARQQAVRAAELAAGNQARDIRNRMAEEEEEDESEEEGWRSLEADGWGRGWREAVVDVDSVSEFSDDEDTPVMTDAGAVLVGPETGVGGGEEGTQHAAAAAASPAAPSPSVAAAAAASESLDTSLGAASAVDARTRGAFLGRFDRSVEQAEREREQRREEDRSRRLDSAAADEEAEGRERQRELKREQQQGLQRDWEQRQQQQQQQGEVDHQWGEAMQRRG